MIIHCSRQPKLVVNHSTWLDTLVDSYADNLLMPPVYRIGEVNTEPSLTQPDMVPSIRELIARLVRGQHVEQFKPQYSEDPIFDSLERMDVFERIERGKEIVEGVQKATAARRAARQVQPPPGAVTDTE